MATINPMPPEMSPPTIIFPTILFFVLSSIGQFYQEMSQTTYIIMAITNHTTPKTANDIEYFFPTVTSVVGTTSPQKETAAQIGGIANAMPTPHNTMRAGVMFFKIKFFI